jgi:hypothetical protein
VSANDGVYPTATAGQSALSLLTYYGWNYPTALREGRDRYIYTPPPTIQSAISNIDTTLLRANWSVPQRINKDASTGNAIVDTYEVQISTSNTFASILQTQYSTGTNYTFTGLTSGITYYTRVRACLNTLYAGEYEYGEYSSTQNATTT